MSELNNLQNFPFATMKELSENFKGKIAEPVVPKDFARQWATHSPDSSIKGLVTFCFTMPFLAVIGMIVLTSYSESIKWYHTLIISIVSLTVFNPMATSTFAGFRKLLIYAAIGFTIYLFIKGSWEFGLLLLLSLAVLLFYELTYFAALKEIVDKLLVDEEFVTDLWNKKLLFIRFTTGRVVGADMDAILK